MATVSLKEGRRAREKARVRREGGERDQSAPTFDPRLLTLDRMFAVFFPLFLPLNVPKPGIARSVRTRLPSTFHPFWGGGIKVKVLLLLGKARLSGSWCV